MKQPNRILDITGRRYGLLVALRRVERDTALSYWECHCDCGATTVVRLATLRNGATKSCGCFKSSPEGRKLWVKHGLIHTREYTIWMLMRQRCRNPKSTPYRYYGARGITVCDEWESFERFLSDMGTAPTPQHSLDRRDTAGNYCKDNCRWATKIEQARNTRTNTFYEIKGVRLCLAEWSDITGVPRERASARIARGWTTAQAFDLEPRHA